jgi:hypothetical protein
MRDFSHTLPEWRNPHGSSLPIEIRDILKAEKRPQEEIDEIESALCNLEFVETLEPCRGMFLDAGF